MRRMGYRKQILEIFGGLVVPYWGSIIYGGSFTPKGTSTIYPLFACKSDFLCRL